MIGPIYKIFAVSIGYLCCPHRTTDAWYELS